MKTLTLLVLIGVLSGCAGFHKARRSLIGPTMRERELEYEQSEQKKEEERLEAERKQRQESIAKLAPGLTEQQVAELIGPSHFVEFSDGKFFHQHDAGGVPMIISYDAKEKKVVGWSLNRSKIEAKRQADRDAQMLGAQEEANDIARRQMLINGLNNLTPKSCTSTNVGGTVYTNCH